MTTHRRLLYRIIAESLGCFQKKRKKKKERRCLGEIPKIRNLKKEKDKTIPYRAPLCQNFAKNKKTNKKKEILEK